MMENKRSEYERAQAGGREDRREGGIGWVMMKRAFQVGQATSNNLSIHFKEIKANTLL